MFQLRLEKLLPFNGLIRQQYLPHVILLCLMPDNLFAKRRVLKESNLNDSLICLLNSSHHYASKAFLRDEEAISIIMNHFLGNLQWIVIFMFPAETNCSLF